MCEILLRGKRKNSGEWVYGCLLRSREISPTIVDEQGNGYAIAPETVGQYTGKELDGEKLFTGDVVESYEDYDDKFGYPATNVFRSVVIWDEENFCFAFNTDGYIQPFNDWEWSTSTKIGNIHDNPELISGDGNAD
jgi:hypothetical protein